MRPWFLTWPWRMLVGFATSHVPVDQSACVDQSALSVHGTTNVQRCALICPPVQIQSQQTFVAHVKLTFPASTHMDISCQQLEIRARTLHLRERAKKNNTRNNA